MPRRLLHVWAGFRSRLGFPSRDRVLLAPYRNRGPLCRHMALRVEAVSRL